MSNLVLASIIYVLIAVCSLLVFFRFRAKEENKRQEVYRTLVHSSPVPLIIHKRGFILFMNEAAISLFDRKEGDVIGKQIFDFVDGDLHPFISDKIDSMKEHSVFATRVKTTRGSLLDVEITSVPIIYEGEKAYQIMIRDLTEQKAAEELLRHRAYHDGLTGLFNRECYDEVIADLLTDRSGDAIFSVMLLDLDHFKKVNDTFGHKTGDKLLIHVAKVLSEGLDENHSVFRLSGDEFAIISHNLSDRKCVDKAAQKVLNLLNTPVIIDTYKFHITTSVGITLIDKQTNGEEILKFADTALYKAKELGRNKFVIFDQKMHEEVARKLDLENALRHAIEEKHFEVHYQPQFNVTNNTITGMEALIRWKREGLGYISPAEFIPIAEDNGLIIPIGKIVFEKVCEQLYDWQSHSRFPFKVAVNISLKQFQDLEFLPFVEETLSKYKIDASWLEVEVTESIFKEDLERTQSILNYLQSLGICISIDDFGTGYSSLSYLKNLPINRLKIDKSFIRDLENDLSGLAIVKTIIGLAQNLDKTVIAEGVETEGQLNVLRENHCNEVQGFLFSKPLPVAEIDSLLYQLAKKDSA